VHEEEPFNAETSHAALAEGPVTATDAFYVRGHGTLPEIDGAAWRLHVHGAVERPLDLSPTNHSRVVLPVRFEWAGLGAGAKGLVTRRSVAYAVTGRVSLDTPLGDKAVALTGKGNVPLAKLLK